MNLSCPETNKLAGIQFFTDFMSYLHCSCVTGEKEYLLFLPQFHEETKRLPLPFFIEPYKDIIQHYRQHAAFLEEKKKLEDSWAACEHEMKTLMDFVHAATPTEFAERVTAHEQHDQLLKDWANIKQDLRFYAGSEEEYKRLWSSLQTGEYGEWMDSYQKLESSIKEGTSKLAALQKEAGALENEILRLAEDESITGKLQVIQF